MQVRVQAQADGYPTAVIPAFLVICTHITAEVLLKVLIGHWYVVWVKWQIPLDVTLRIH